MTDLLMTDLLLAIVHHSLAFALVAILAAEIAACRLAMDRNALRALGRLDAGYGATAALLVVAGALRVFYGAKGADFYAGNLFFWCKMTAFAGVALLSLPPTLQILRWRAAAGRDATFMPPDGEVWRLRTFFAAEVGVFVLIPAFAAAMARSAGS